MTRALVVHTSVSGIGFFSSCVITLVFFCPAVSCSGQGPYPVWVIEHGTQQGTWTWWMLIHDLWQLRVFAYANMFLIWSALPLFHLVNPYSFKTPAKMSLLPLFLETSHGVFPIQSWFPLLSQPFITRLQNLSHSIALHFYETLPVNCELLEDWVLDSRGLSWGALLVPMGDLVHKAGWRLAGPWPCSASWVKGWCPQCPQVPYAGNTVWKVIQTPLLVKTT